MNTEKIKVVIADDQVIYRDGLQLVLAKNEQIDVVGEAENGRELISLVEQLQPDVVLTDVVMPVTNGIEATLMIAERFPNVAVIGLSMYGEETTIMDMIHSGALGYLIKNADKKEIYEAIEAVHKGKPYYCKSTYHELTRLISRNRCRNDQPQLQLSEKEVQIITGICDELSNQEMGKQMFMSKRTIDGYRARLLEKLGVKSGIGVVKWAIKEGIYKL